MAPSPLGPACAEDGCNNTFQFDPLRPQRIYCHDPACKAIRVARMNREKKDRIRKRKADGEIAGIGGGRYRRIDKSVSDVRRPLCLKCDKPFTRQRHTDYRMCDDCHRANEALLSEYAEEALGVSYSAPSAQLGHHPPAE